MFSNAKVDDKAWSFIDGWGKIIGIDQKKDKPIIWKSFKNKKRWSFTVDGKLHKKNKNPVLFWNEIKFTINDKSKNIINKEVVAYANVFKSGNVSIFYNRRTADMFAVNEIEGRIACVKLTGTYKIDDIPKRKRNGK